MHIEASPLNSDINLVRLNGRLDSSGVDSIETRFTAAVVSTNRHAAVDLSGVSFLASMGIRMLIASARAMNLKGHKMVLFGATEGVQSVLDTVALDQIIPIVATEQEAVQRLTA